MTEVQHVTATSSAGVNYVDVPISAAGAGNSLAICGADDFNATVAAVSDGTISGSQIGSAAASQGSTRTDIWFIPVVTTGATNVRITFSSSFAGAKYGFVFEVSGLNTPTDGGGNTATSANAGSTTLTGGTVTPTGTSFMVGIVFASFAISQNPKSGNEFSSGGDMNGSSQYAACSLINASAAGHTPAWLDGISTARFCSSTAALKAGLSFLAAPMRRPNQATVRAAYW